MGKPILCLDFDGVLHAYTSGWQGVGVVQDGPVPGAAAFLAKAVEHFEVNVYSSRSSEPDGLAAMGAHLLSWLVVEHGQERGYAIWKQIAFPMHKPAAMVGIDDRVITFTGHWPDVNDLLHFKPWNKREESNLVRYAKEEMARLRAPTDGPDEIQDAIERGVLDIVQRFADQGHSGSSGAYALGILTKVLDFEPLTPLTGADDEWVLLDYENDMKWQNKRCASVFKRADGTAYHSSAIVHRDPDGACYTGSFSRKEITFPYTPKVTYVDVDAEGKPVTHAPTEWALWWQGSDPRGDHIMEAKPGTTQYIREIAYIPSPEGDDPEVSCKRHEAAQALVDAHNESVRVLSTPVEGQNEVQQRADILLALEAALVLLGRNEPGDSRAVSDQFVAMASAVAGKMNTEGRLILQEILLSGDGLAKVPEHKPAVVFVDPHAADPQQSGG